MSVVEESSLLDEPPEGYEEFVEAYERRDEQVDSAAAWIAEFDLDVGEVAEEYSEELDYSLGELEDRLDRISSKAKVYDSLKEFHDGGLGELAKSVRHKSFNPNTYSMQGRKTHSMKKFQLEKRYGSKDPLNQDERRHTRAWPDVEFKDGVIIGAGRTTHEILREADERGYDREKIAEEINKVKEERIIFDKVVDEEEEHGRRKQGLIRAEWGHMRTKLESELDHVPQIMKQLEEERIQEIEESRE
ncbi:MAG: hypothetical protein ABEK16_03620 [Candidatus Nanohalobium sp.]